MSALQLSNSDLVKVRSSWADIMALNHYRDEDVVNKMFHNLVSSNREMKAVFRDPATYGEQKELFAELLKFTMMYLHNEEVLAECMDEFIKENPSLIKVGVNYLEPMGGVMIHTMRTILGRDKFHAGLETLWIKVYIYIANCILQLEESDVDLVMSAQKEATPEEEPVKPLNFASPAPSFKKAAPEGENTINIDLGGNAKYKGFRRLIAENNTTKVSVRVPATFVSAKTPLPSPSQSFRASPSISSDCGLEVSFDPRPLRRSTLSEEPVITPRSSRRGLISDDDYKVRDKNQPVYDPRRKTMHRRTPSDLSVNMEYPDRRVSGSSCDSPVSEVEDTLKLEDDMDFTQPKQRPQVFDYNSFGIKGLDPIVESENDDRSEYLCDNGLSNYAATVEKLSEDENLLRTSSLSLHNLDYKSSISLQHLPTLDKAVRGHSDVTLISPLPALANPYSSKSYACSVPSLSSRSLGQRASLGFMRSSFILKKEMSEIGYNHPENVEIPPRADVPSSRSVMSLPTHHKNQFSQVFEPVTLNPKTSHGSVLRLKSTSTRLSQPASRELKVKSKEPEKKEKERKGFRKMLGSIFGSSPSPPPQKPVTPQKAVAPQKPASQHNKKLPQKPSNLLTQKPSNLSTRMSSASVRSTKISMADSYSSYRMSSLDIRSKEPSRYEASVYLKPLDATSLNRSDGALQFFAPHQNLKHNTGTPPKKVNKYLVKKVPHRTIYIKDLVR